MAGWLDDRFTIPGTNIRFGLDALVGLIPGGGDAAGAVLAAWVVGEALTAGAPGSMVARMVGRVLFETLVGSVPVLGDLFDIGYRANRRNADDLEAFLDGDERPVRRSRVWVWAVVALQVGGLVGLVTLAWWAVAALVGAVA